jgi:hypothetical protein
LNNNNKKNNNNNLDFFSPACGVAAGAYSFMLLLFGSVILNMGDFVSEDSDEEVLIHKLDGGGGGAEGNMKLPPPLVAVVVLPAPPLLKLLIGLDFISNFDVLPFFFVKP